MHTVATVALPTSSAGNGLVVTQGTCFYAGFSVRETAGAPASLRIRKGSVTGTIIEAINLPASSAAGDWYGLAPIESPGGIYVEVVSGAIEGSVRYM